LKFSGRVEIEVVDPRAAQGHRAASGFGERGERVAPEVVIGEHADRIVIGRERRRSRCQPGTGQAPGGRSIQEVELVR